MQRKRTIYFFKWEKSSVPVENGLIENVTLLDFGFIGFDKSNPYFKRFGARVAAGFNSVNRELLFTVGANQVRLFHIRNHRLHPSTAFRVNRLTQIQISENQFTLWNDYFKFINFFSFYSTG